MTVSDQNTGERFTVQERDGDYVLTSVTNPRRQRFESAASLRAGYEVVRDAPAGAGAIEAQILRERDHEATLRAARAFGRARLRPDDRERLEAVESAGGDTENLALCERTDDEPRTHRLSRPDDVGDGWRRAYEDIEREGGYPAGSLTEDRFWS